MICPYCGSTKIIKKTNIKFKSEDVNALDCGACGKPVRNFGGILPCINDVCTILSQQTHYVNTLTINNKKYPIHEVGIYESPGPVQGLPTNHAAQVGQYYVDIFKLNDVLNKEYCDEV